MDRLAQFLRTQPRFCLVLEAALLSAIFGVIDYATGYELSVWPFYSIPILLCLWFGNRQLAICFAILSAFEWWLIDIATGHVYSQEWLRAWDATIVLAFLCLVTSVGLLLRQQRDEFRARLELLERSRRLENEIIGISEREQQRIGRDLHDGVCQYLAAIGFTADMLKNNLQKESHPFADDAGEIAHLVQDAATLTRDLARGLSPVDRDEGGLEAAMQQLTANTSRLAGIPCSFTCHKPIPRPSNEDAIHLFRIAQEALGNALKHAQPKSVVIELEDTSKALTLKVTDDGIGFAQGSGESRGMGLNTMRYRAEAIKGRLEIHSSSPGGTTILCTIDHPVNGRSSR